MAKKSKAEISGTKMANQIKKYAAKDAKLVKKSAKKFAKAETRAERHLKKRTLLSA